MEAYRIKMSRISQCLDNQLKRVCVCVLALPAICTSPPPPKEDSWYSHLLQAQ
jgi:hypothetical protein